MPPEEAGDVRRRLSRVHPLCPDPGMPMMPSRDGERSAEIGWRTVRRGCGLRPVSLAGADCVLQTWEEGELEQRWCGEKQQAEKKRGQRPGPGMRRPDVGEWRAKDDVRRAREVANAHDCGHQHHTHHEPPASFDTARWTATKAQLGERNERLGLVGSRVGAEDAKVKARAPRAMYIDAFGYGDSLIEI